MLDTRSIGHAISHKPIDGLVTLLFGNAMQDKVRKCVQKLQFEKPEALLDDVLQMTSQADIVEECIAAGCEDEAAAELADLLME